MSNDAPRRKIELEVEVPGTPEEVWDAIATGPGISSWYVPHTVEERAGGAASASFGPGPEMQVPGRVAAWEPPRRIVFDGGEGVPGLAFEWLIEARDGGSCLVRLVNSGFGDGNPWDDQYDAMNEGWRLFLRNLQLHRTYFPGRYATSILPMAMWPGDDGKAWPRLLDALGLPHDLTAGQQVAVTAAGAPPLAGSVIEARPGWGALLLDAPLPGTAILAAESHGGMTAVSVWAYLYGDDAPAYAEANDPVWRAWIDGVPAG